MQVDIYEANGRARSAVRLGGLARVAWKIDPAFHAPWTDRDLLGR